MLAGWLEPNAMAIERVYHCDGPECERHASSAAAGRLPDSFLAVTGDGPTVHFCSWDCVLRFSAQKEPTEVLPVGTGD